MKLSIIIPCYNCEKNIGQLLKAIGRQLNEQVELIVVNDGAVDRTGEIIATFISENPSLQIKSYVTENGGAAKARQYGLERAEGDYVFFCDSDDAIAEDFVSRILNTLAAQPDMIFFSARMTDANHNVIANKVVFETDEEFRDAEAFFSRQLSKGMWTAAVWTYVFRRHLIEQSHACFTSRQAHEDHLFTLRLLVAASKIVALKDYLYTQKITSGSLTNSRKDQRYIAERFKAFEETREEIKQRFSAKSVRLYDVWSIKAIIALCRQNIAITLAGLVNRRVYAAVWKYKALIPSVLFNK